MPFAKRLLPSDTIYLSQHSTAAVLMEYGGSGSQAALFAREMGLPCARRCFNGGGYESVALIPFRFGAEVIGLLQLNGRRSRNQSRCCPG